MLMAKDHMVVHNHMLVLSLSVHDTMCPMSLFCFSVQITTTFIMWDMTAIIQRPIWLRESLSDDSHTTQKYTQHRT